MSKGISCSFSQASDYWIQGDPGANSLSNGEDEDDEEENELLGQEQHIKLSSIM